MIITDKIIKRKEITRVIPAGCGSEKCEAGHSYGPAIRDYILLHFVISGKGKFVTPRGQFEVASNEMFIIHPYEITYYEADKSDPWNYIWIGFNSEKDIPAILMSSDVMYVPYLKNIFENAVTDIGFPVDDVSISYETYLAGLILQMLGILLSKTEKGNISYVQYVKKAISIIESEYALQISVEKIAKRLHINRCYFSQIFKQVIGISPRDYIIDFRMKKAASLLNKKRMSISVVALSVGYPDAFSFSRAFKNYFGISPTEYTKKYQSAEE